MALDRISLPIGSVYNGNPDASLEDIYISLGILQQRINRHLFKPVGSVYLNVTGVDPSIELGYGTWTLAGSGYLTLT